MKKYSYHIVWSEEDQEYAGCCDSFPSLSWMAKTPAEALAGIEKLIVEARLDSKKNNRPVKNSLLLNQALKRPANFEDLSGKEQRGIDKRLGILDWDPTPAEAEVYRKHFNIPKRKSK